MESAKIFFKNTVARIINGEFDKYMDVPFASKRVLVSLLKSKIDKRIETGATPIVSDAEILSMIDDVKEVAAYTYLIFKEVGVLEEGEDGLQVADDIHLKKRR